MRVRALACLFVCLHVTIVASAAPIYCILFCVRDPQGMINCNKNDRFFAFRIFISQKSLWIVGGRILCSIFILAFMRTHTHEHAYAHI